LDTYYDKIKIYCKNPGDGNNVLTQAVPGEKQVDKLDRTKVEEGPKPVEKGQQLIGEKQKVSDKEFAAKAVNELKELTNNRIKEKKKRSSDASGVEREILMSQIREEYNKEMDKYEEDYERRMDYKRKVEKKIEELYSVITARRSAPRIYFKSKDISGINIDWNKIMNSPEYKEMNFTKIIEKFEEPILTTFLASENVPLCVKCAVFYVVQELINTNNEKIRYHLTINQMITQIVLKGDFTLFEERIRNEKEFEEKLKDPKFANSETTKLLLKRREEEVERATMYYYNRNGKQEEEEVEEEENRNAITEDEKEEEEEVEEEQNTERRRLRKNSA
jgi:hypothetical protein